MYLGICIWMKNPGTNLVESIIYNILTYLSSLRRSIVMYFKYSLLLLSWLHQAPSLTILAQSLDRMVDFAKQLRKVSELYLDGGRGTESTLLLLSFRHSTTHCRIFTTDFLTFQSTFYNLTFLTKIADLCSKNWEYYVFSSQYPTCSYALRKYACTGRGWPSFGRVQWKKVSWVSNLLSVKTKLFWKKRRKYQKKHSSKVIVLILNNFNDDIVNC